MSKKKPALKTSIQKQAATTKHPQKSAHKNAATDKRNTWIYLSAISVITFAVFFPSLKCEFTNWDDGTYVTQNPMIWKLDAEALKEIFTTPVSLNYHPLTMLSLAIDYSIDKLNPYYYHLNNVLIHILNVLLVFVFIKKFLEGYNKKTPTDTFRPGPFSVAVITSAFWGIHPMRVESVTWVAERKDVLYMFFFLLSLIFYLRYLDDKKIKWMAICFLMFICSCLSKGMGVVLPVVLVLIDWFYGDSKTIRQIFRSIFRKTHFFLAALIFGVIAFKIQSQGAIASMETFSLFQRLTFGCYGFIMYIWKLILPVNLSAFYPYPFTDTAGNIPTIYYAAPFIVLLLAGGIIFLFRKKEEIGKVLAFGFAFYFITITLVLQFISVGSVIMADRYAYASYTGIFFIIGYFYDYIRKKASSSISSIVATLLIITAAWFSYLTHERTKVWTNAETLWTDAMNQFPFIEIAYENRGVFYKDLFEKTKDGKYLDMMLKDYVFVTENLHSKNEKIWSNLGNLYGLRKEFDKSLNAYSRAIEISPTNSSTYLNRAITYSMMGQYEKALPDYDKSIELAPAEALTYKNRAYTLLQLGHHERSIADYDKAIELFPYDTISILNRGIAKFNGKKYEAALEDFSSYLKLIPNSPEANYNASVAAKNLGRNEEAIRYALTAQALKYPVSQQYIDELKKTQSKK